MNNAVDAAGRKLFIISSISM